MLKQSFPYSLENKTLQSLILFKALSSLKLENPQEISNRLNTIKNLPPKIILESKEELSQKNYEKIISDPKVSQGTKPDSLDKPHELRASFSEPDAALFSEPDARPLRSKARTSYNTSFFSRKIFGSILVQTAETINPFFDLFRSLLLAIGERCAPPSKKCSLQYLNLEYAAALLLTAHALYTMTAISFCSFYFLNYIMQRVNLAISNSHSSYFTGYFRPVVALGTTLAINATYCLQAPAKLRVSAIVFSTVINAGANCFQNGAHYLFDKATKNNHFLNKNIHLTAFLKKCSGTAALFAGMFATGYLYFKVDSLFPKKIKAKPQSESNSHKPKFKKPKAQKPKIEEPKIDAQQQACETLKSRYANQEEISALTEVTGSDCQKNPDMCKKAASRLLGINENSPTDRVVKKAFRKQSIFMHPDKHPPECHKVCIVLMGALSAARDYYLHPKKP